MNHSITNSLAALLLIVIGMVGCSQEAELPHTPDATRQALTISVTDGGYAASDKSAPQSRAVDNGYTTTFAAGDKIGLYVVKNGVIMSNNIALTHNGTGWVGDAYWEGADAKYFAYYPYQSTVTGALTPSATDAAGFFANVVSAWTPATDQSTHALYTASDLMIGAGTVGDKSGGAYPLTFTMTHAMALVVIETLTVRYTLSTDGNYTWVSEAPAAKFYGFTPCIPSVGIYRYLVKPTQSGASELRGSYTAQNGNTREYIVAQNSIAAGTYVHYKIDNTTVIDKSHTLTVGDFYLKDGSLVAHDATLTDAQKAACIGIVYWVGDATAKDKTLKTDHPGCTHGLVISLNESEKVLWQNFDECVQDWLTSNKKDEFLSVSTSTGASEPLNNIQGYNNTKAIEAFNVANQSSLVTAVQKAVEYRMMVPAPLTSSDWYLPSAKEFTLLRGKEIDDIWNLGSGGDDNWLLIDSKLRLIGGVQLWDDCWASSEFNFNAVLFMRFSDGNVFLVPKENYRRVRCSLAF